MFEQITFFPARFLSGNEPFLGPKRVQTWVQNHVKTVLRKHQLLDPQINPKLCQNGPNKIQNRPPGLRKQPPKSMMDPRVPQDPPGTRFGFILGQFRLILGPKSVKQTMQHVIDLLEKKGMRKRGTKGHPKGAPPTIDPRPSRHFFGNRGRRG